MRPPLPNAAIGLPGSRVERVDDTDRRRRTRAGRSAARPVHRGRDSAPAALDAGVERPHVGAGAGVERERLVRRRLGRTACRRRRSAASAGRRFPRCRRSTPRAAGGRWSDRSVRGWSSGPGRRPAVGGPRVVGVLGVEPWRCGPIATPSTAAMNATPAANADDLMGVNPVRASCQSGWQLVTGNWELETGNWKLGPSPTSPTTAARCP